MAAERWASEATTNNTLPQNKHTHKQYSVAIVAQKLLACLLSSMPRQPAQQSPSGIPEQAASERNTAVTQQSPSGASDYAASRRLLPPPPAWNAAYIHASDGSYIDPSSAGAAEHGDAYIDPSSAGAAEHGDTAGVASTAIVPFAGTADPCILTVAELRRLAAGGRSFSCTSGQ